MAEKGHIKITEGDLRLQFFTGGIFNDFTEFFPEQGWDQEQKKKNQDHSSQGEQRNFRKLLHVSIILILVIRWNIHYDHSRSARTVSYGHFIVKILSSMVAWNIRDDPIILLSPRGIANSPKSGSLKGIDGISPQS
jgi:hypothetical protein